MTLDRYDAADHALLARAGADYRFELPLGAPFEADMRDAFERGIDNGWFILVDVVPTNPAELARVFRLTPDGIRHRVRLAEQLKPR